MLISLNPAAFVWIAVFSLAAGYVAHRRGLHFLAWTGIAVVASLVGALLPLPSMLGIALGAGGTALTAVMKSN